MREASVSDDGWHTSAMLPPSLFWMPEGKKLPKPAHPRRRLGDEALRWQGFSQRGSLAEIAAWQSSWGSKGRYKAAREANRLSEIHGLMGAIGEQLALAWAAEQDTQAVRQTARYRTPELQTMQQRAVAEFAGHFTLGATHSLANLVLRLLLLNGPAAQALAVSYKKNKQLREFPIGSDEPDAWPAFGPGMVARLAAAAEVSGNRFMQQAVDKLGVLQASADYQALERRRGMDYHRLRPQSVRHGSPRVGPVSHDPKAGVVTLSAYVTHRDPEADADAVYDIVVRSLVALHTAMVGVRTLIPRTIRAEGVHYRY
jgi:hypothetical protein